MIFYLRIYDRTENGQLPIDFGERIDPAASQDVSASRIFPRISVKNAALRPTVERRLPRQRAGVRIGTAVEPAVKKMQYYLLIYR